MLLLTFSALMDHLNSPHLTGFLLFFLFLCLPSESYVPYVLLVCESLHIRRDWGSSDGHAHAPHDGTGRHPWPRSTGSYRSWKWLKFLIWGRGQGHLGRVVRHQNVKKTHSEKSWGSLLLDESPSQPVGLFVSEQLLNFSVKRNGKKITQYF